jgi:hypothetical protein
MNVYTCSHDVLALLLLSLTLSITAVLYYIVFLKKYPHVKPLLTLAAILPSLLAAHILVRSWLAAAVFDEFSQLVPVIIM